MWKFLFFYFSVAVLSADAKKLKLYENTKFRENLEISHRSEKQQKLTDDDLTYRLPNNSHPDNYDLLLDIKDFDKNILDFDGDLTLYIKVLHDTNILTLHSDKSLTIEEIILSVRGVEISSKISFDSERDFLIIEASQTFTKGTIVRQKIKYKGRILINTRAGIYRGSYLDENEARR